jgi:hypothetical protein
VKESLRSGFHASTFVFQCKSQFYSRRLDFLSAAEINLQPLSWILRYARMRTRGFLRPTGFLTDAKRR